MAGMGMDRMDQSKKKVGQLSQVLKLWLQKSSKNYYGQGSLVKFVW